MSRYFALTLGFRGETKTKKSPKTAGKFAGRIMVAPIMVAAMLVIVAGYYLVQVNAVSTKGYEIKNLEKRLVELKEQNKRLELEAAAKKSLESIGSEVQLLNLVPSGEVLYLDSRSDFSYRN